MVDNGDGIVTWKLDFVGLIFGDAGVDGVTSRSDQKDQAIDSNFKIRSKGSSYGCDWHDQMERIKLWKTKQNTKNYVSTKILLTILEQIAALKWLEVFSLNTCKCYICLYIWTRISPATFLKNRLKVSDDQVITNNFPLTNPITDTISASIRVKDKVIVIVMIMTIT